MVTMDNFYEVPSRVNLRIVVDYWFTFRAAAELPEGNHEVTSCPGCVRKAEFQKEIVENP